MMNSATCCAACLSYTPVQANSAVARGQVGGPARILVRAQLYFPWKGIDLHAVFVLPRFYPYRGGYENSMLAICRCLVDRGHRVSVFTTTTDDLESLWVPGY